MEIIKRIYQTFQENGYKFSTDSRKIIPNCVFFALKGINFNGNLFADEALKQGAAAVVVDQEIETKGNNVFFVDDVLSCFQKVATLHRKEVGCTVISITGSNGKTTTKELVYSVLKQKYKTWCTQGNFNNHIGVPITLLNMPLHTEIAVIEMGANAVGEVKTLCEIAKPDYALITSIGKEHLEGFGSFEAIIETEGENFDYVAQNKGMLFVYQDDENIAKRTKGYKNCMFYGASEKADIIGRLVDAESYVAFRWDSAYKAMFKAHIVNTQLIGHYNLGNLLAAAAVGRYFSVPYPQINEAIATYKPSNMRSQLLEINNKRIILDAYNANPASMELAIDNLMLKMKAETKGVILGDMLELGSEEANEHLAIIEKLKSLPPGEVILVGPAFFALKEHGLTHFRFHFSVDDLKQHQSLEHLKADLILVKGSRGIGVDKFVK